MNILLEFKYFMTWVRILTCLNTLSVWPFPWSTGITLLKADGHLSDQEIPYRSRNSKAHCCFHDRPPLLSVHWHFTSVCYLTLFLYLFYILPSNTGCRCSLLVAIVHISTPTVIFIITSYSLLARLQSISLLWIDYPNNNSCSKFSNH